MMCTDNLFIINNAIFHKNKNWNKSKSILFHHDIVPNYRLSPAHVSVNQHFNMSVNMFYFHYGESGKREFDLQINFSKVLYSLNIRLIKVASKTQPKYLKCIYIFYVHGRKCPLIIIYFFYICIFSKFSL